MGVTKAVRGNPIIAQAMLDGGAAALAESRISNVIRLREANISCPISLIRSPMLSQVAQVVQFCDVSYNSEIKIIEQIAAAARRAKTTHNVILVVEMGDLREGVTPDDLAAMALQIVKMAGVNLIGIAANFACLSGIRPDAPTMRALSDLATETEAACGPFIETVSGGNSANLPWALGPSSTGRINNLRLGEAILLGRDPISGQQIGGLSINAFTLVAEVIETKAKATQPRLALVDPASTTLRLSPTCDAQMRSILSIGTQDTDVDGLTFPMGINNLGATSDHLVVHSNLLPLSAGDEVRLQMNYSALTRIMSSPDMTTVFVEDAGQPDTNPVKKSGPSLELV